jgi:hypothetical protein
MSLCTITLDWNKHQTGGWIMAEETPSEAGQVEEIQNQINQALKELDQIRNKQQSITTPVELQAAALKFSRPSTRMI